jgi:hypothetical protein
VHGFVDGGTDVACAGNGSGRETSFETGSSPVISEFPSHEKSVRFLFSTIP